MQSAIRDMQAGVSGVNNIA